MTDKPTPTDAELKAMWQLHAADIGGIFHYARAVLAKWGQPPAGAGEVAEHYRNAIASACEGWTMPDGLRKHLEDALWNPPTPQPTQTRPVAREPLPKFLALKFHARRDKKATVTLLFPGHEAADAWVRGIKGGQHGDATSQPTQPDPAYSAACNLATALFKKHFAHLPDFASGQAVWSLCDSTAGVISQIDNMVSGLVQPPTTSPQTADSVTAPAPPPECETEAEKRAFAFGWFKALEAERMKAESVQEDAARYRWLRERSSTMFVNVSINGDGAEIAETLDSAVDAARKQGEKQ